MSILSIPSFLAPLPAGLSATNPDFMLAGADKLYVATAEQGGFASLGSLPLAPRLGEAPGGYHPFSDEKMQRAREWFRGQAGDLKISPDRAEALGDKILSNLRCIDPITFKQALIQMGIAAAKFIGDEPYRLIINRPFSSHWFVYQSLRTMGLIPEAASISDLSDHVESCLFDRVQEISDGGKKIIVLDDCAYEGSALKVSYLLKGLNGGSQSLSISPIDGARIFVGLVAASERARDLLFSPSASYYVGLQIDQLNHRFDDHEEAIEGSLMWRLNTGRDNPPSTFTWYKLPDNLTNPLEFCGLSIGYLMSDENGNQMFPSAQPFYYEMLNPDLLISFPAEKRHDLRRGAQDLLTLSERGESAVAKYLRSMATLK